MANRARAPRNLCRDAAPECQTAGRYDGVEQPVACRRLDHDRFAGNHRRGHPVRQSGGRSRWPIDVGGVMNRVSLEPKSSASASTVDHSIEAASRALIALQQPDGHWVFELEADATIPAEYILLRHYLAEPIDTVLEAKIAAYLRRIQGDHGGWPLFHDGAFDMSASVKAYFALKMIGDPIDAPHMARAREAILKRGGAANVNVFTRFLLTFFDILTWRSVPVLPIEIMLLPRWSPFHLYRVSYW